MPEGLEGFKILVDGTYDVPNGLQIIIGLIAAIAFVCCFIFGIISFSEGYWKEGVLAVLLVVVCVLVLLVTHKYTEQKAELKVSPIQDDYHIDISKYEIVGQEGSIFTVREK